MYTASATAAPKVVEFGNIRRGDEYSETKTFG